MNCIAPESRWVQILVEESGEDDLRHVVADYEIAIRRAEIPAKSRGTLPESTICVGQLALAAEQSRQADRTAIDNSGAKK